MSLKLEDEHKRNLQGLFFVAYTLFFDIYILFFVAYILFFVACMLFFVAYVLFFVIYTLFFVACTLLYPPAVAGTLSARLLSVFRTVHLISTLFFLTKQPQ
jgi:hypothetical protein